MLKTSLFALFALSMATLTISASSLPVPTDEYRLAVTPTMDVAGLD